MEKKKVVNRHSVLVSTYCVLDYALEFFRERLMSFTHYDALLISFYSQSYIMMKQLYSSFPMNFKFYSSLNDVDVRRMAHEILDCLEIVKEELDHE